MENPLHALGYKFLNASLHADPEVESAAAKLTRRGFLLATVSLSSCAAAAPLPPKNPANANAARSKLLPIPRTARLR